MASALVTGAAGFVGRNLVRELLTRNREVCAMVHYEEGRKLFEDLDVETFVADIRQREQFADHVKRADEVYHLASVVAPSEDKIAFDVNVGGTENLADLIAASDSPAKLIYVSSLSAAGPCKADESGEPQLLKESDSAAPVSIYGKSKLAAEAALASRAARLPISVVRPPGVFGFWDQNLLSLYKSIAWRINTIGISKSYRYSFVHVQDLVNGLIEVADQGKRLTGENDPNREGTYFITDPEAITFVQLGNLIARSLQCGDPLHLTIPKTICTCVAGISQWYGNTFGKRVYLNLDKIREAKAGWWACSGTRAREELGFEVARSLADRIVETGEWYREQGWL